MAERREINVEWNMESPALWGGKDDSILSGNAEWLINGHIFKHCSYFQNFWNNSKKLAHLFFTSFPCFTGPERVKPELDLYFMDVNRLLAPCPGVFSCSLLCMQVIPESRSVRLLQGFHLSWAQQNFRDHNRRFTCTDRIFLPPAVDGWETRQKWKFYISRLFIFLFTIKSINIYRSPKCQVLNSPWC